MLIEAGAKVIQATNDGYTPIYLLASQAGNLEVVKALIKARRRSTRP